MSQASGFSDCSTRFHILPACVQNPAWTHSVVVNKSQKSARDKRLNCPKGFKVPWFGSIKVNLLTCPVTEWFCSLSDHIGIEHTALMGYFLISRHIRAPLSLQISQAIRGTLPVTIWTIRKHSDLHGAIRHIWFSFLFFLHGHLQPPLCFSFSKFFYLSKLLWQNHPPILSYNFSSSSMCPGSLLVRERAKRFFIFREEKIINLY